MLAGERFSDHPRSVCPVIAAFLRSYNDHVDDRRRQDLYDYAAQAVGIRGSRRTPRVRVELCRRFVERYEVTAPPRVARLLWVGQAEQIGRRAGAAAALAEQPRAHSAGRRCPALSALLPARGARAAPALAAAGSRGARSSCGHDCPAHANRRDRHVERRARHGRDRRHGQRRRSGAEQVGVTGF